MQKRRPKCGWRPWINPRSTASTHLSSAWPRRAGLKVVLSGLGADELFGGYPSFRDVPKLVQVQRRLSWLPSSARRAIAGLVTPHKSHAVRRKFSDILNGTDNLTELYFHRRRLLSNRDLHDLGLDSATLGLTRDYQHVDTVGVDESDPIRSISELESRFYQGNMLLRDSDVMGMAHSLEIRVPFLGRRLLDEGHAIPGRLRLPQGAPPKYLLRQAFSDLLRPALLKRPKTGFTLPLTQWMLGPMRPLCNQSLRACSELAGLPAVAVRRVWDDFIAESRGPQWSRALAMVVLGDFLERNNVCQ